MQMVGVAAGDNWQQWVLGTTDAAPLARVLAEVAEEAADALTVIDPQGRVVFRNPGGRRLLERLGHDPERTDYRALYPSWALKRLDEAVEQARRHGPCRVETALLDPEGQELPLSQTVMCHEPEAEPGREYVSLVSRDVSELRFAHALLRAERDVLSMIASSSASLDEILGRLCRYMDELSKGGRHSVLLVNGEGTALEHCIGPGLSSRFRQVAERTPIAPDAGSCGTAAYEGQQVVIPDVADDPRWDASASHAVLAEGLRGCTSTPIADGEGSVLGTFAVYFPTARGPNAHEHDFIASASWLAAVAIQQRRREAEAEFLSTHDFLTRLPNRALLHDRTRQAIVSAQRDGAHAALVFVDLDGFKDVNDRLGHSVGDRLLRRIAELLRVSVRAVDTVARLGGDEFVVLLSRLGRPDDALRVIQTLLDAFAEPLNTEDGPFRISISIGVAAYPDHGETVDELLQRADAAMYAAKRHPGSTYAWADSPGAPDAATRR